MLEMEDTLYNLKWRNHENHMLAVMDKILASESFADVTLVCAGDSATDVATTIKAHKILLGASSPYFEVVFSSHPTPHPVIILPPGIRSPHINHVLHFIYRGEVQVPQEELAGVLNCASQLRIRGLEADSTTTSPSKDFMLMPRVEYSRESSVEPERPGSQPERPASQMSGAGKRKSSPKFHFLKNHRHKPNPIGARANTPEFGGNLSGVGQQNSSPIRPGSVPVPGRISVTPCAALGLLDRPNGTLPGATRNITEVDITNEENEKEPWEPPMLRVNPIGEMSKVTPVATNQLMAGVAQGHFLHSSGHSVFSQTGEKTNDELTRESGHDQEEEDDNIEEPVDFTIKSEMSGSPGPGDRPTPTPDFNEMAAFFAAVRNSGGQQQEGEQVAGFPGKHIPAQYNSKNYTKRDMNLALEALRSKKLSLSRASEMYGIPPTTLWQRANRMGIPTPKKETANKTWSEEDLNSALEALRQKKISANKAAKVYKIPSSTLYKIARKEGIELAQPFNAVATTWTQEDLNSALDAIKGGQAVQKAAAEYGIPSGTLYGRCKKVGIELSKAATVHWSEDDMIAALESVRTGTMSINQAAIHFSLPYSSLYGRINRLKRDESSEWDTIDDEEPYDDISNGHLDFSEFLSIRTSEDVAAPPSNTSPPRALPPQQPTALPSQQPPPPGQGQQPSQQQSQDAIKN